MQPYIASDRKVEAMSGPWATCQPMLVSQSRAACSTSASVMQSLGFPGIEDLDVQAVEVP